MTKFILVIVSLAAITTGCSLETDDKTPGNSGENRNYPPVAPPDIGDMQIFPEDNPWNTDISGAAVDPMSDAIIARIGGDVNLHPDFGTVWEGASIGIPYTVVSSDQPKVAVTFDYADESDPGPYPIPPDVPIEGSSDRHVIVIDRDNLLLYEMWDAHKINDSSWHAGSGAIFDLTSNDLRPDYWTSADAAGLPLFAGLVRYEEVDSGEIPHALRFTVTNSAVRNAFIHPATHSANPGNHDDSQVPMGARFRLKADVDISGYSPRIQVILTALKTYGMFVADNGSSWFLSGTPDPRWDDEELAQLKDIKGSDFELVEMGDIIPMQ
ncbi:MAG: hypothetical protein GY771_09855 [bacterium]|nr:hypothetical protein [bacterium]